ncbi:AAA family ATPase [Leuconostoc citreum]
MGNKILRIIYVDISNYRVLDGINVSFDEFNNYIVGKNNVGKTCMLDLLDTVLNGKDFKESDFADINKQISINIKFKLSPSEYGVFEDNFSAEEEGVTNLSFTQVNPDEHIQVKSNDTDSMIYTGYVRSSNIVSHSSNIKPLGENDLTFMGRNYNLVPELVKKYMSSKPRRENDQSEYDNTLLEFLNKNLSKIDSFKDNGISVDIDSDYEKIITRSLTIRSESGIDFSRLGFGIQFSSLVPLKIIDKIIYWDRYNQLSNHIVVQSNGEKVLNIILTLDEPEVHLHPNLQVQTMANIRSLLRGLDTNFNSLLKQMFDIDKIIGQSITVTHSPKIFSTDYKEIIRFTTQNDQVFAISGNQLKLDEHESKQLKRQFPYFADALFADGVILVEGDTEQTAIPKFAENLGINLVAKNINVVRTDGVQSMPGLRKLLDILHIRNLCVIDSDGRQDRKTNESKGMYVTTFNDFEYECFDSMTLFDVNRYLNDYFTEIKAKQYELNFWMKSKLCCSAIKENDLFRSKDGVVVIVERFLKNFNEAELSEIKYEIQNDFIGDYLKNKSILNGGIIASNIRTIPSTYSKAISAIVHGL